MGRTKDIDNEIIELWKKYNPSAAYTQGFDSEAGVFFIPSGDNMNTVIRKAKQLKEKASDQMQLKVLDAILEELEFDEPQMILEQVLGSIFNHMVKEGIVPSHMKSLLNGSIEAVRVTKEKYADKEVPIGVKVLTLYRLDGILGILDVVSASTEDSTLRNLCSNLASEVKSFVSLFDVDDFGHGEFERVYSIFEKYGFDLGRKAVYDRALKRAYDYSETSDELEEKALGWLNNELREIRRLMPLLAKKLDCSEDYDAISQAINSKLHIRPEEVVDVTKTVRDVVMRFVNENLARINPRYDTRVIETPKYLTGTIPSAAAGFFDTFTDKPFQLYFVTTDKTRDPIKSLPDLINTLVHEEYGHCLHHSNSATNFIEKLRSIELFYNSLEGPITEGLSFNREIEFLEVLRKLEEEKSYTDSQRGLVKIAEKYGGLSLLSDVYEFETRRWRLIRFLRVIGDVRLNTGKQGMKEFLHWAERTTGLHKASIYYQLFPAHEYFPGYATCYAVVGQEVRAMEREIADADRVEFQTYLCSIGSPPRSIYKEKLKSKLEMLKNASS
ncbi:MAG: hypothetical protein QXX17_04895 [Conexivisphaerales archaeon]